MSETGSDALPRPYALALRLAAVGADDLLIADCLEVDVAAVPTLLQVARAKVAALAALASPVGGVEDAVLDLT